MYNNKDLHFTLNVFLLYLINRVELIRILFLKLVFSMAKLPAEYEYDN